MRNKSTNLIIGIGIFMVLAALFAWPRLNNPNKSILAQLKSAGLECMNGHANALQHFHPHLTIVADGLQESLSANRGIVGSCMAEIHTHNASGTLHVESINANKVFYLKNVFAILDKSFNRDGYNTIVTLDGQVAPEGGNLILKDGQKITVEYNKSQ